MPLTLAIETSCDESAVAVINDGKVLSSLISSQVALHALYDGVVPELASREHIKNTPLLFSQALNEAGIAISDIKGIAVTQGPGLKGCLLTGIGFAKGISVQHQIPFLGINHIEGHIFSPFVGDGELPAFPFLALIVSGGHTELHLVTALGEYECLTRTGDDAAGEAFDKAASLLGFQYPGGRALSEMAAEGRLTNAVLLPGETLPKVAREIPQFSFSGLKTAIALLVKRVDVEKHKAALCRVIEDSIVDAVLFKTKKAVTALKDRGIVPASLVVGGGVSANAQLKCTLEAAFKQFSVIVSPKMYATDNAAMIGWVGEKRLSAGERSSLTIDALPSWRVEQKRMLQ
jgi:N6-L-threonylcarbamoyladenine synthase